MLTREALSRLKPDARLEAGRLRSARVSWERRKVTEEDTARVREVLGDDAAGGRVVPFVISTEGRASDGHVLKMGGALLERYERNPSVFWGHDRGRPRIGDSVVWVEGDKMRSLAAFLQRDLSEALDDGFSWAIGELAARRGHAASIGFDILGATPAPEEVRKQIPWALDVHSWQLEEWSLVGVGADADAISEGRADGLDTAPLVHGFSRMLDELEGAGFDRKDLEAAWLAAVGSGLRVFTLPEPAQEKPAAAPAPEPGPAPERAQEPQGAAAEGAPADVSALLRGSLSALL